MLEITKTKIKNYIVPIIGTIILLLIVMDMSSKKPKVERMFTVEQEACIMNHANEISQSVSTCRGFSSLNYCRDYYLKLICNIYDNDN